MWVIDKMAGADNLISEIDFVTKPKTAPVEETVPMEEGK